MTTTTSTSTTSEVPRPTLTVAEAADLLGVSQWLVLQQIQQGNLPHKRFGRRILISRARFTAWLEEGPHAER
jgi:excisionase family DNA binding protein